MESKRVEVRISPRLEPSEKDCIRAFQKRSQQIIQTRVLQTSGSIRTNLSWSQGEPITVKVRLPPEEDLRSFYMAFRFFYLEKEKSNFLRVANIVRRRSQNDLVDQHIIGLKQQWNGVLARKGWNVSVNSQEVTAKRLIDLWFNAHYFHSDEAKRLELEQLATILSNDFSRYLLADAVFEATKAVLTLYSGLKTLEV